MAKYLLAVNNKGTRRKDIDTALVDSIFDFEQTFVRNSFHASMH